MDDSMDDAWTDSRVQSLSPPQRRYRVLLNGTLDDVCGYVVDVQLVNSPTDSVTIGTATAPSTLTVSKAERFFALVSLLSSNFAVAS